MTIQIFSRKSAATIIKLIVAAALLYWLISSGRLDFKVILSLKFSYSLLFAFLLMLLFLFLMAVRWWWLLRSQNIILPLLRIIELLFISGFLTTFLPGQVSGEVVRGFYITQDSPNFKAAAISSVLVDRALGLYALLFFGVLAIFYFHVSHESLPLSIFHISFFIILITLFATLMGVMVWIPQTQRLILKIIPNRFKDKIMVILTNYYSKGSYLSVGFLLSIFAHASVAGSFIFLASSIQTDVTWSQVFLLKPLIIFSNYIPISPGGLGVGETVSSYFFKQFSVVNGAEIALLSRMLLIFTRLPGGILYILHKRI
ncbi:flippase-like domain-containing protein [bacterium]|nr:flippase-like domain-containing protein [bacterium]